MGFLWWVNPRWGSSLKPTKVSTWQGGGWRCNRLSPFHGWLSKVIWLSGSTMHSLAIQCCKCVCMPAMSDEQTFSIDVFHFITTVLMVLIFLARVYICIDMPCTFCGWISIVVYIYIYRFCIPVHFVEFCFVWDVRIYIYSYVLAISKEQKAHIIHYRTVPRLA
jgi:hypothetical protein